MVHLAHLGDVHKLAKRDDVWHIAVGMVHDSEHQQYGVIYAIWNAEFVFLTQLKSAHPRSSIDAAPATLLSPLREVQIKRMRVHGVNVGADGKDGIAAFDNDDGGRRSRGRVVLARRG
jgi:hypothetical protein